MRRWSRCSSGQARAEELLYGARRIRPARGWVARGMCLCGMRTGLSTPDDHPCIAVDRHPAALAAVPPRLHLARAAARAFEWPSPASSAKRNRSGSIADEACRRCDAGRGHPPAEWWSPGPRRGMLSTRKRATWGDEMTARVHQTDSVRNLAGRATEDGAAVRALFAAASRVLSYRAAALDAKVTRSSLSQGLSDTDLRAEGATHARHT
jgi:hypothetical protein